MAANFETLCLWCLLTPAAAYGGLLGALVGTGVICSHMISRNFLTRIKSVPHTVLSDYPLQGDELCILKFWQKLGRFESQEEVYASGQKQVG